MSKQRIGYVPGKDLPNYRKENAPKICPILKAEGYEPVVDHDHRSGRIRGVVSREGNALLGKVENFFFTRCATLSQDLPEVLRAMAEYLEQEQGPYHPVGIRQVTTKFKNQPKPVQIKILEHRGIPHSVIKQCRNGKQRSVLYRKHLETN